MLDQVLQVFGVAPDYDLNLMQPGQTLAQSSARILAALEGVLTAEKPDMVLVQGDTTTTFCGALAAFYARIPVGHVEAGTVKLVGAGADRIVRETAMLLENRAEYERMSRAHNPYGDGHASERIGDALARWFGVGRSHLPLARSQVSEVEHVDVVAAKAQV